MCFVYEASKPEVGQQCVLHHAVCVECPLIRLAEKLVSGFDGGSVLRGKHFSVLMFFIGRYPVTLQKYWPQRFLGWQ